MELGLTRRNLGRLLLVAWAAALAWLARREFAQGDSAETAHRATELGPSSQYFAVMTRGHQIGQLNISVDTLVDGVRLTELLVLDVPDGDTTRPLVRSDEIFLSSALRLRSFTRILLGGGLSERLEATIGADSILSLRDLEGSGVAGRGEVRIPPDAILPSMLPYRVAFGGHLQVGARFVVQLLDPAASTTRPVEVSITAESTFVVPDSARWDAVSASWVPALLDTVRAWRVEHQAPGVPTASWVDAQGAIVHQETIGGFTLDRSAFEIVRNNYRRSRQGENVAWRREIPAMLTLIPQGIVPDTTVSIRAFQLQHDFIAAGGGWPDALSGGRQSFRGDTVTISRATAPDSSGETSPDARAAFSGPTWDAPILDESIRAAGRRALAGARTPRDSAVRLTLWVARQIQTDRGGAASVTAPFTLQHGRGSADGKARLLVTMARAAGIPARVVSGLAVLPTGSFGHSWTELWLGAWVAADPTFGHFPASASLVRLAIGTRSRPVELLPMTASARFLPLPVP
jgi:hypothetical protein